METMNVYHYHIYHYRHHHHSHYHSHHRHKPHYHHLRSTGQPGSGRNLGSRPLVLEGAKSWLLLSGSGLEAEDLIMRRSPIIVMLIKKNTFCLCSFEWIMEKRFSIVSYYLLGLQPMRMLSLRGLSFWINHPWLEFGNNICRLWSGLWDTGVSVVIGTMSDVSGRVSGLSVSVRPDHWGRREGW